NGDRNKDNITGNALRNTIRGGAGENSLYGMGENDYILDDSLTNGNDLIYGGVGDDVLDGAGGNDSIYGESGNDVLTGGAGNDQLFGGDGGDTFNVFDGYADTIDGGAGDNATDTRDSLEGSDTYINFP